MKKQFFLLVLIIITGPLATAQSPDVMAARKYNSQHADDIIREYIQFLSIPNLARDTVNMQATAAFIMSMMNKRGIQQVQLLRPTTAGAHPSVYGEVMVPGAKQTLIFYAHYDG
ncbi:MAG: hypothetical protein ABIO79_14050, partial [Ferruginibacter sp.]